MIRRSYARSDALRIRADILIWYKRLMDSYARSTGLRQGRLEWQHMEAAIQTADSALLGRFPDRVLVALAGAASHVKVAAVSITILMDGPRSQAAYANHLVQERQRAVEQAAHWLVAMNPWWFNPFRREPRYTLDEAYDLLADLLDAHFPPAKADDEAAA